MLPLQTASFDEALCHARQRSFATRKPALILLDCVQACLYVLVGPHEEFLKGREVVLTVTPDGREQIGG